MVAGCFQLIPVRGGKCRIEVTSRKKIQLEVLLCEPFTRSCERACAILTEEIVSYSYLENDQ
jgi:hypothetical protein